MKMRGITTIVILLLSAGAILANIQILQVENVICSGCDESTCTGSLEIIATGNAGPFMINIPSMDVQYSNVDGILVVPNICVGSHTVEITPALFPACQTILPFEIQYFDFGGYERPGIKAEDEEFSITHSLPSFSDSVSKTDQENYGDQFRVFPNPTTGELWLELEDFDSESAQLQMVNVLGEIVLQQTITLGNKQIEEINVSDIPPGVYLLWLRFTGGMKDEKMLCQKVIKH